ncbi:MAG: hypothetical protein DHS20C18_32350 [Saprospiraceae bacterium]|nr:MAG: hypothetical protein DHS20C18_32350 [Saprospiraceae bacterium]
MNNKLCVSLTHAEDNLDKASIAFTVANGGLAQDREVIVFLSSEAVKLSLIGYADNMEEEGFPPLIELINNFLNGTAEGNVNETKGTIWICTPCFEKRKLKEKNIIPGAKVVGGALLIKFLDNNTPCISF